MGSLTGLATVAGVLQGVQAGRLAQYQRQMNAQSLQIQQQQAAGEYAKNQAYAKYLSGRNGANVTAAQLRANGLMTDSMQRSLSSIINAHPDVDPNSLTWNAQTGSFDYPGASDPSQAVVTADNLGTLPPPPGTPGAPGVPTSPLDNSGIQPLPGAPGGTSAPPVNLPGSTPGQSQIAPLPGATAANSSTPPPAPSVNPIMGAGPLGPTISQYRDLVSQGNNMRTSQTSAQNNANSNNTRLTTTKMNIGANAPLKKAQSGYLNTESNTLPAYRAALAANGATVAGADATRSNAYASMAPSTIAKNTAQAGYLTDSGKAALGRLGIDVANYQLKASRDPQLDTDGKLFDAAQSGWAATMAANTTDPTKANYVTPQKQQALIAHFNTVMATYGNRLAQGVKAGGQGAPSAAPASKPQPLGGGVTFDPSSGIYYLNGQPYRKTK